MPDEEPSLNIPSLLTLAVVSFFVIRWFFKRDGESGTPGSRSRVRGNVVDPAQVEQISQMFPQLSTRDIMWDLQRNSGNVAATTERILTGRGLDTVCSFCPSSDLRCGSLRIGLLLPHRCSAACFLLRCAFVGRMVYADCLDCDIIATSIFPAFGRYPPDWCPRSTSACVKVR
jgi:hypothetical protein